MEHRENNKEQDGPRNTGWLKGRFKDDFKLFGHLPAKQESTATFWALIIIIAFAVAFVLSYYVK